MTAEQFVSRVVTVIVNPFILLLFGVAVLVFLSGVFRYIAGSNSDEARTTGRSHIIYGLIGMFIMVSVFGIIHIIVGTFNISNDSISQLGI